MRALLIGVWLFILSMPVAHAQTGSQGVAQPEVVAPGGYLVFFALDQATLTEADRQIISQAVEEYRRTGAAQITAVRSTLLVFKSHGVHDLVHNSSGPKRPRATNRAPNKLRSTLSAEYGTARSWMLCKHGIIWLGLFLKSSKQPQCSNIMF